MSFFMKQPLGIAISNRKSHAPKTIAMRQHRIVEADRCAFLSNNLEIHYTQTTVVIKSYLSNNE